jgi:hypothetical protein
MISKITPLHKTMVLTERLINRILHLIVVKMELPKEPTLIFHGTSAKWVDKAIKKYGRLQSPQFTRDSDDFSSYLSISFEIEEALAYAIKHASATSLGSVLVVPLIDAVRERFDFEGWEELDAPIPYFLPHELLEQRIARIPVDVEKILRKSSDELYEMIGDPKSETPVVDVHGLVGKLWDFCDRQVDLIKAQAAKTYPGHKIATPSESVLDYLKHNGTFTKNFGWT